MKNVADKLVEEFVLETVYEPEIMEWHVELENMRLAILSWIDENAEESYREDPTEDTLEFWVDEAKKVFGNQILEALNSALGLSVKECM